MQRLVGIEVPPLRLTGTTGSIGDPLGADCWTVLYCFPGARGRTAEPAGPPGGRPGHSPPRRRAIPGNWSGIPGAGGCTLESITYWDRAPLFNAAGAVVRGVSTQRPDQLEDSATHAGLPFPLLSDQDHMLSAALRLPRFRASGQLRLKRLTLLVDPQRRVRTVQFPILDPAASVDEAVELLAEKQTGDGSKWRS